MKNKKLVVIAALVMILAIALMAFLSLSSRPQAVAGEKTVTVLIVHKDGTEKKLEYTTDKEYLAELLLAENLMTGEASDTYGYTIHSVDGVAVDWDKDGAYWAVYENDAYAMVSVADMVLKDGSVYKLAYESI